MKNANVEFKVGFFVLLAMMLLAIIVFQIGGIKIFKADVYHLNVIFDFVSGIEMDAPVHVAGVSVGQVEDVNIDYGEADKGTRAVLSLAIKKGVLIPRDSSVYINTLGILGDKYVEIVPGKDRLKFAKDHDTMIGKSPVTLERLTESLADIVGDERVKASFRETIYNFEQATGALIDIVGDAQVIDSFKRSIVNFEESTENLSQVSKRLLEITEEIQAGNGTVGRLIKDDSIYVQTEQMIVNLNHRLESTIKDLNKGLNEFIRDLKMHPWKLFVKPSQKKTNKKKEVNDNFKQYNKGYLYNIKDDEK